MIVVDASVALQWLVAEHGSLASLELLDRGTLTAPDFMPHEVRDTLGQVSDEEAVVRALADAFARLMPTLALDLVPSADHIPRACRLAAMLRQPVLSCVYLALAESLHARLATADAAFAAAVRACDRIAVPVELTWEPQAGGAAKPPRSSVSAGPCQGPAA